MVLPTPAAASACSERLLVDSTVGLISLLVEQSLDRAQLGQIPHLCVRVVRINIFHLLGAIEDDTTTASHNAESIVILAFT